MAVHKVILELGLKAKDAMKPVLASAMHGLTALGAHAKAVGAGIARHLGNAFRMLTSPMAMLAGGAGLAGLGYGVKSYLTGAVGIAGQWEGYLAKLTVALKSATKAAAAFEWAKQFAATTPFEMGEVVDATTRLEMYGLSAKKWIPLVGDMAGAMGKNITDAVEAIADAISGGGLERLKEFGISSTALLKAGAKPAAGGMGVSYQGQEAIDKLKAALISIMSERYGGGMTKLLTTWMGKTSNLADAWNQIKGTIGRGMMPVLKSIVDTTTEWLNSLVKSNIGQTVGKKLGEWIAWAWGKFQTGLNWAIANWPTLRKKLTSGLTVVWLWAQNIAQKIADWLGYGEQFRATLGQSSTSLADMGQGARDFSAALADGRTIAAQIEMIFIGWKVELMEAYRVFALMGAGFNKLMQIGEATLSPAAWAARWATGQTAKERTEWWSAEAKWAEDEAGKGYAKYNERAAWVDAAKEGRVPGATVPSGGGGVIAATGAPGGFYQVPRTVTEPWGPPGSYGTREVQHPGETIYYGPGAILPKGAMQVASGPVRPTYAVGYPKVTGDPNYPLAPANQGNWRGGAIRPTAAAKGMGSFSLGVGATGSIKSASGPVTDSTGAIMVRLPADQVLGIAEYLGRVLLGRGRLEANRAAFE